MAEGQSPFQKKLLGLVESVFGKPEAPPPEAPAKPQPGRTGALPRSGAAPAAPSPRRADSFVSGGSDPLTSARAAQTGQLGPQKSQTAGLPASAEDPAAASKRRMGLIMAYMKDAQGDPAFQDKTLMYRILTEERSYQQEQIQQMKAQLEGLSDEEPGRAELEERVKTAQNRQTQLFILLKRLTGIQGKTGGTGFLAKVEPTD